jgi:hypothetical protein
VDLNRFADKLAGTSRLAVQDLDMNTQASMNRSLFTLNPQQEKETDDSNP